MSDRTVLALVPPAPAAPREQSDVQPGHCIEQTRRYRLLAQIGEGGMGTVWRAVDEALDREVAIKFLKPDVPVAYRRRFRREAKIGAGFDHPNLVRVLDAGSRLRDGGPQPRGDEWLAMDLLQGHDLGALLEMQGRIGVPVLVDVFSQALAALAYIHARRLVHRDIKPYNIFVARGAHGFVVKLIDFGICRNLATPEAADDHIVGDPRYMPPEQATLGAPVDARTDLYALGLSFVQAATGAHPFAVVFDGPVRDLLRAHRTGLVAPPSAGLPGGVARAFGRAFDDFVATACAPDPAQRFADADAMLAALRRLT
jgi:serine/threonine protein kinase